LRLVVHLVQSDAGAFAHRVFTLLSFQDRETFQAK
jgi:hypothetical protein